MKTDEQAQSLADRIGHGLPADEIWLFGSKARGEANVSSDFDFLVVVSETEQPGYIKSRHAHALVSDIDVPKDIVVITKKQWERQEGVVNTLPFLAKKEGRLLYRR